MSKFGKRVGYVPEVFELLPTRQYLCDFQCGKVFKNRLPYEMHLQRVHGVVSQGNGFDFFKCPIENCDYNGGRLNLLRRHYQCHHMEKNYSCSNCDRKFLLESQFIKHRCDVREYGCPRCFKIFKVLNRRNRHVKICTKRELVVPEPIIDIKVDFDCHSHSELDNTRDTDTSVYDGDVTVEEFEQLIQDVENKTIQDPELISELANLTPVLESLLS